MFFGFVLSLTHLLWCVVIEELTAIVWNESYSSKPCLTLSTLCSVQTRGTTLWNSDSVEIWFR